MDHAQKNQEKHNIERKEKQAHERQSEARFSQPGAKIRPHWFLVLGIGLTLIALVIWFLVATL